MMKKKILAIDDSAIALKQLQNILEKKFDFVGVTSGLAGLKRLDAEEFDLVLLDIEMPVMNGIKTLEVIKENPDLVEIPVMFLTAAADVGTVVEAGTLGVVDYIKKPFLPDELVKRVKNALIR